MKFIASFLLICSLLAFVIANEQSSPSTISVSLYSASNTYWIAIALLNANVDTSSVQIKDSVAGSYGTMHYHHGWGYYTYSTPTGDEFQFPLYLILTDANGHTVTTSIPSLDVSTVDTGNQYPSSPATVTATVAPVSATSAPSKATTAPSKATTAPSKAPTAASHATVTATTKASATVAPAKPTTAPAFPTTAAASGCSAPIKLMVPLYEDPDSSWNVVAAGAASVQTVAIINPNSGPGTGPDSNYITGMAMLHAAGVEMVGYVHTSYGARAMADVKADIAVYASEFPLLVGIFIDEAAATDDELTYYAEIYAYIMSFPGWTYDIINPGTVTTVGYLTASTQIVSFEDKVSNFVASDNPSFASCSKKNNFIMISYAASTSASMQSAIAAAQSKGYFGWVYVTNGAAGGNTYNSLATYYAEQVSYIASFIN